MTTFGEVGGERLRRRNHATGVTVVLSDARDDDSPWDEGSGGRWVSVCLDHDGAVQHTTRALAVAWMAEPWVWCGNCQSQAVVSQATHAVHLGGVKDRKGRDMMEQTEGWTGYPEEDPALIAAAEAADAERAEEEHWREVQEEERRAAEQGPPTDYRLDMADPDDHHDDDACDLDDPHDAWHHANDDRPGAGRCGHIDCQADGINDDRLTGVL